VFEREKQFLLKDGIVFTAFEASTQRGNIATILHPEVMNGPGKYEAIRAVGKQFREDGYSIDTLTFIMAGRNMLKHSQKSLIVCMLNVVTGNIQIMTELFRVIHGNKIVFEPNSRHLTDKAKSGIIDEFMHGYENK
jgi:hypothetical protein